MNGNIYHELILELYRNPLNKGTPAAFDESFTAENRVCGDSLIFFVSWDKNNKVSRIHWDGNGCALSVSSASLFSEFIRGKSYGQIKKIRPEEILKLLQIIKLNPSRSRCAFLPLESFRGKK